MRPWVCAVAILTPTALSPHVRARDEPALALDIRVERSSDRQVIDGFGGSLAFWGFNAGELALEHAFGELGATIVRIPAEVSRSGDPEAYRNALRRVARVAPMAKVVLTFWQPRSRNQLEPEKWLDVDTSGKYRLKPAMAAAWAEEMVARASLIRRDWGANVVAVGVQNEPNYSVPGTQTCAWEPDRLSEFMAHEFAPRLVASGLGSLAIAAPELAYIGENADQPRRFAPALAGSTAAIFSYHMYDSYKEGDTDPGLDRMRARQRALGSFLKDSLATKRVWMTETTGAQYNGKEWHTLGWVPGLDEHDKAIAAARYMHTALVDAGANAFLWWGLVYSEPPPGVVGAEERQKFRDEGLILVRAEQEGSTHAFLERTSKSYVFQQFAKFVRPGWVRLDVAEPPQSRSVLVAAFRKQDDREVAVVLINPAKAASDPIEPHVTGKHAYRLARTYVTDRGRLCEPVKWSGVLPPQSVTTLIYLAEDPTAAR
jgi:O-glycosyl hydrolase